MKKGDIVLVKRYKRTSTIFSNADNSPGTTTEYPGGWTGVVANVFDGGTGGDIVEVYRDGQPQDTGPYEFSPSELEVVK